MIEGESGHWRVTAPMVMDNARGLLEAGRAVLKGETEVVDLGSVPKADSSALAVMLGWLRTMEARGGQLRFSGVPAGVRSLADLYGVAELLPLA